MATSDHMATALLTEHFRYTPLTLLDDIINTVNELVFRAINAIDEGLNATPPEALGFHPPSTTTANAHPTSPAPTPQTLKQTELDTGIVQLESLLNATVDRDFDKFEIYVLRNILAVGHADEDLARWVRLEHYRELDFGAAKAAPSEEAVRARRAKVRETAKLGAMLRAEERRNAAILEQLRGLTGAPQAQQQQHTPSQQNLSFLTTSPALPSLPADTSYILTHLPALREHLSTLKSALDSVQRARHTQPDEPAAEAERRRYVEAQARRAAERRGVDVDAGAERGATGRRASQGEVEGIEAVAGILRKEG